jgi:AmmeMemoRadiSam system protein B
MREFKVNDFIILKLENGVTNIYINKEFFNQCKFLMLEIPIDKISSFDEIKSIDEAVNILDRSMEGQDGNFINIPPETEFWGHCSNLQVWTENNYDTRLLHSNLSFPLLKKLTEVGDPIAKKVFKEEIAKRIGIKSDSVIIFFLEERYLDSFNRDELGVIFDDCLFINACKKEKLLDYLVTLYLKARLWDLLIRGLKSILTEYPKNAYVLYYLGLTYLRKSYYLNKFICEFKNNKSRRNHSSDKNIENYDKNLGRALVASQKAIEINPNMINAWNNLSQIYKLQKDIDNAIETSKQALKMNATNKIAQYNLINLYYKHNEVKKANIVEIIQQINSEKTYIKFDYKCPTCGKNNNTDFIRIKFCRYCKNELSKSGKYRKFNLRKSALAGFWYPEKKDELIASIEKCFKKGKYSPGKIPNPSNTQRTVIGGISPNSGYLYSGYASAHTYLNLFKEKIPDTVIILGPDLVGYGKLGTMGGGEWETPLGNINIDSDLSLNIIENCSNLHIDDMSFIDGTLKGDNSIEVQLPFIKYCSKGTNIKIVPIIVTNTLKYDAFEDLSFGIANAIEQSNKDIVCVAVGVMSHISVKDLKKYKKLDEIFIKSFTKFLPKTAYLNLLNIPGSGLSTITLLMLICKKLGANKCKALKYYTSYDLIGSKYHSSGAYSGAYFSGMIIKK